MSFGEVSTLLAQLDANHSSPILIWNAERRARLRLALEDELSPIVESLRVHNGRVGGFSAVMSPGAPAALLAKLEAAETDLKVGGLFLEPFVVSGGKFSFATAAAAGHFLAALITALQDVSRTLHSAVVSASRPRFAIEEEAAALATGAQGAQDDASAMGAQEDALATGAQGAQDDALAQGAQDDAFAEAIDDETAVGRGVGRHAALMWKALLQLLTLHTSLCTHRACVAAADFFFGSVRSPMPITALSLVLQVLQALCKPGAVMGAVEFVSSVKGAHLLGLVALSTRTPTLAAGSLGLVFDLVRRSPAAVLAFLRLGGLVLLLHPLLEPAAPAAGTETRCTGTTRLLLVRVLSALMSDSRHGAEIAECVCELLTTRFRMLLEGAGAHPEAFLAFLEADHTAGPSYSTHAREWDAKRRTQLRALLEQAR